MTVLHDRLMLHRQQLSMKFNGIELIPQPIQGNSGVVDAQNGPKPQGFTYIQLNNTTFLGTYHIIAHYFIKNQTDSQGNVIVPVNNIAGNPVLYNRWAETVDIDTIQMSQRTRDGKFVIRSDAQPAVIADQLRNQMAVTGVPKGFLRASSNYTQSPDGLGIRYHIVDKQQYKMPPSPAFEAEGEYIESTNTPMGIMRSGQARVLLRGDKTTDQAKLVQVAIDVCCSKLRVRDADFIIDQLNNDPAQSGWIEHGQLRVDMFRNEVECILRMRLKTILDGRRTGLWGMRYRGITTTPGSSENYTPNYYPYGNLGKATVSPGNPNKALVPGLLLQAAAYYDPSLQQTLLNKKTDQLSIGVPPGRGGSIQGA